MGFSVGSIVMQVKHDSYGYMILAMLQSVKKIIRLKTMIVSTDEGRLTTVEVSWILNTYILFIMYVLMKFADQYF